MGFPPLYYFSHDKQGVQKPTRKTASLKAVIVLEGVMT